MDNVSDMFLVRRAQRGDDVAAAHLVKRYERAACFVAKEFFAPGMTFEDLLQSAYVGLLKAVRLYNPARSTFRNYAFDAMRMELISTIKSANRGKHSTLNDATTIESLGEGDRPREPASAMTPERIVLAREKFHELCNAIDGTLTDRERTALLAQASGRAYAEIGPRKSVDNDIQRARRKLAPMAA